MLSYKTKSELNDIFGGLAVATVILERNEDSEWSIYWQNKSADFVWGAYEIDEDFELKLALMDAMTRASGSSFVFKLPSHIHSYRFTVTPENDRAFIQFLTERRQKRQSIDNQNQEEDVYRLVVERAGLGVFDWDIQADTVIFTDLVYEVCGLSSGQIGSNFDSFFNQIHPEDKGLVSEKLNMHLKERWPFDAEFRIKSSIGNYIWLQATGQGVWCESSNKAIRFVGMLQNISERKVEEKRFSQREALIEKILDSLPISIYVKDAQGCFKFFNKQAEAYSGFLRGEVVGRTDYEIYPLEVAKKNIGEDQAAKTKNDIIFYEEEVDINFQPHWHLKGRIPLKRIDNVDDDIWSLGFAMDITYQKRVEEKLKQAKNKAEVAGRAKVDFLSVMSHEIRTPLNAVIGTSYLLLEMNLLPEEHEHAKTIKSSGEHLLHLINDILDSNKLDAGKMTLENHTMDLKVQAQTVVSIVLTTARAKDLPVKVEYADELNQFYKGDESRLRQILLNFLSNGVKFTESGEVVLRISQSIEVGEVPNIRFEVIDTGMGIPEDKIGMLFSEFTQVDASTTRKFGGTGLGLSICKKLVEAMNGKIGVTSQAGKGSCFWFEIPMLNVSDAEAEKVLVKDLAELEKSLNILVAEDNLPNQLLIKAILKKKGHKITIVDNGLKAVEAIKDGSEQFDLILMDMQMPVLDGLAATVNIRDLDVEKANVPIIALTANVMEGDKERVLKAGMNDYLTKPIDIKALNNALRLWGAKY